MCSSAAAATVLSTIKLHTFSSDQNRFIACAPRALYGEGWGEKAGDGGETTVAVMRGTAKRAPKRMRESAFQPTVPTTSAQRRIPRTCRENEKCESEKQAVGLCCLLLFCFVLSEEMPPD